MYAEAFSPCHITGLFQIFDQSDDALRVGSRGAGVSLSRGVKTAVRVKESSKNSLHITVNGSRSTVGVSKRIVNAFLSGFKGVGFEVTVEHHVEVPVGAGFGTSGAMALSLALALNEALGFGMSKIEVAQLAHVAEVECKTGLGTVIAETFGGLEIRVKPGAPGIGEIVTAQAPKDTVMACLHFGPLSTRKFLMDESVRMRVNEVGGGLVDELIKEPSPVNFMRLSRRFAEHVGLMSGRLRKVLKATDGAGFICSMPMFGESAFTLIERNSLGELLKVFRECDLGGVAIVSEIDYEGARVLR